ncbi:MAG TPA: serine/threonine-protein kinase [Polyangiaceae bacterium]|nr:serine/threonine-protein kinase [Polyangiaceae bacterium]
MSDPPSFEATATPTDILGHMAGEYRLRRKLGEGGYGTVYEAEHPLLRRRAAVKVLHRTERMDSAGAMRFISEAQAANQIRSRYIVDVFSFGKLPDGRHFYVMDLLDGEALDRYIAEAAPVAVPDAIQLLSLIAEALDAAHAAGIVHRDLKPQNIFLVWEPNGETVPKLLDFGMAKLVGQTAGVQTASGAVMGTPLYMAPEQALGKKIDGRADVYALGILTHELLTGKRPITGETAMGVLAAHLTVVPPRASEVHSALDPRLDAPILRMLEKNPDDRPATAGLAIAALKQAAEEAGHVIRAEGPRLPRPEQAPRSREATPTATTDRDGSSMPPDMFGSERGLEREVRLRTGDTSPPKHRATWPFALLALVAAAATYAVMRTNDSNQASVEGASSAVVPAAGVSAPVADPARAIEDSAKPVMFVDLTLQGAPRGARVLLDGKPIGEAPGPVPLPAGDAPLQVTVTAPGYDTGRVAVVPNQAASAMVMMRRRAPGPASSREGIPRDLENPF